MGWFFVLGASDPEMVRVERLLDEAGVRYTVAVDAAGERVAPSTAYSTAARPKDSPSVGDTVVAVECGVPAHRRIDHHRPGDPGYGQPPERFFEASSLGQTFEFLRGQGLVRREPTRDEVLAAAADHCLHAAYRGLCPGVDPDELMRWRVQQRAEYQRRPVEDVMRDVQVAVEALRSSPKDALGVAQVAGHVPELPEAAVRLGQAFTAEIYDRATGRAKLVLQGADEGMIRAWMEKQKANGYEVYGDPIRGFAGCYTQPAPKVEPKL
jgi:hypothetical protein